MTTPQQYGAVSVPPRRASGGVTALGVLNIIYAILFRLCCGISMFTFSLVFLALAKQGTDFFQNMPQLQGMQMEQIQAMLSGPMQAYSMIKGFVLLILGIALLSAGIGLLKVRPWARTLSLAVAVAEILWTLLDLAINFFFIYPSMSRAMAEQGQEVPQMVGNVVGGVFFSCTNLVYPVVLLICLNLSSIREQFEPDWSRR